MDDDTNLTQLSQVPPMVMEEANMVQEIVLSPALAEQFSTATPVSEVHGQEMIIIPISVQIDADDNRTEYLEVKIEIKPNVLEPRGSTDAQEIYILQSNCDSKKIKGKKKPKILPESSKCEICQKEFSSKNHLQRHINLHTHENLYKCNLCTKVCFDKSTLQRHCLTHTGQRSHVCKICEKTFTTSTSLKRHLTMHAPESRPFACDECKKRFPDKSSFTKHLRLHTGVKPYSCELCSKSFYHVGDLNLHKKCHDNTKPFDCLVCGKKFSRLNNLTRHKNIHIGPGKFVCDICGVQYQHAGTLTRHILSSHPVRKKGKNKRSQIKLESSVKELKESCLVSGTESVPSEVVFTLLPNDVNSVDSCQQSESPVELCLSDQVIDICNPTSNEMILCEHATRNICEEIIGL